MDLNKSILLFFLLLTVMYIRAEDYPASLFGIKSDGSTLNTRSIQFAIDHIHNKGGGRLVFSVGRYLTGSIHLKSGVGLHLEEGAVLLGSLNSFDYDKENFTALILANKQKDISITGTGVIEGQGRQVAANIIALVHSGIINDPLRNDRPTESIRPMIIYFRECSSVLIKGVTINNSASWVQTYDQCEDLNIDSVRVDSKAYWNNDGFDIVDCNGVRITNCFIDAADDGICLKSHDAKASCNNILIRNCTIRSSANAIKFGTASYGGFSKIRIINNKIFDTYRSAIAFEAVDGGFINDIIVDSLNATNTGNAIFLRIGERVSSKKSSLKNIHISNIHIEIPSGKPDSGYAYEGPVEDQPRNISPIVITGMPDSYIDSIVIQNISVKYPGGGNASFAFRSLQQLDSIPELPAKYPEFSMFKELPAWAIYIRHAKNLQFENINLSCVKKDYRTPIVLDDVHQINFTNVHVNGKATKANFFTNKSSMIYYR
jgi:polygalacturonase